MATGHTHHVLEGDITTLSEFAYECTKSFVWSWRDGNRLAYPPRFDSYHVEKLSETVRELTEWDNASEEERYAMWSDYADRMEKSAEKARAEAKDAEAKILPILEAACGARKNVPDTHKKFNEFMIDQLRDTLQFDATFKPEYYEVMSYPEWYDRQRPEFIRTIDYHTQRMAESQANSEQSREWIDVLAKTYNLKVEDA